MPSSSACLHFEQRCGAWQSDEGGLRKGLLQGPKPNLQFSSHLAAHLTVPQQGRASPLGLVTQRTSVRTSGDTSTLCGAGLRVRWRGRWVTPHRWAVRCWVGPWCGATPWCVRLAVRAPAGALHVLPLCFALSFALPGLCVRCCLVRPLRLAELIPLVLVGISPALAPPLANAAGWCFSRRGGVGSLRGLGVGVAERGGVASRGGGVFAGGGVGCAGGGGCACCLAGGPLCLLLGWRAAGAGRCCVSGRCGGSCGQGTEQRHPCLGQLRL